MGCGCPPPPQALTSGWPPSPTGQTELRFPSSQPGGRPTRGNVWKWAQSSVSLSWRSLSKAEKSRQGRQPEWAPSGRHSRPSTCCCIGCVRLCEAGSLRNAGSRCSVNATELLFAETEVPKRLLTQRKLPLRGTGHTSPHGTLLTTLESK